MMLAARLVASEQEYKFHLMTPKNGTSSFLNNPDYMRIPSNKHFPIDMHLIVLRGVKIHLPILSPLPQFSKVTLQGKRIMMNR